MKKLILSVTALAALSTAAMAQGIITIDATQGGGPITIKGALDTTQDINFELLYSATGTAGTFSPVATLLLSSAVSAPTGSPANPGQIYTGVGDITGVGTGYLYDLSGAAFGIGAAGATVYFEAEAWIGTDSYATSPLRNNTTSGTVFTEVLSAATSPISANLNNLPALDLTAVPEPSTLAMAGVGLASMLIFRRRK